MHMKPAHLYTNQNHLFCPRMPLPFLTTTTCIYAWVYLISMCGHCNNEEANTRIFVHIKNTYERGWQLSSADFKTQQVKKLWVAFRKRTKLPTVYGFRLTKLITLLVFNQRFCEKRKEVGMTDVRNIWWCSQSGLNNSIRNLHWSVKLIWSK